MKTEGNEFAISIMESVRSANIKNKFATSILEMSLLCQQQKNIKTYLLPTPTKYQHIAKRQSTKTKRQNKKTTH